jgi:hypothetical protein
MLLQGEQPPVLWERGRFVSRWRIFRLGKRTGKLLHIEECGWEPRDLLVRVPLTKGTELVRVRSSVIFTGYALVVHDGKLVIYPTKC